MALLAVYISIKAIISVLLSCNIIFIIIGVRELSQRGFFIDVVVIITVIVIIIVIIVVVIIIVIIVVIIISIL